MEGSEMPEEYNWVNIRLVKFTEDQKDEDYTHIEDYREISVGAEPGEIIYGTMLVLDEEIGKLIAKPWVSRPYPAS